VGIETRQKFQVTGKTLGENGGRPDAGPFLSGHNMTQFWRSVTIVAAAMAILCGAASALGQSTRVEDLAAGKLLVSSRALGDPNFAEAVVLLIQYDDQGAVGLMINRRTKATISSIVQNLNTAKHGSDPIYIGGPVEMTTVLGLLRSRKKADEAISVLSDVYLVSGKAPLEKTLGASVGPGDMRLYLGYCGWTGGQLENEMRLGGWWIFDGNAGLVFDPEPGSVWPRLIALTEQEVAMRE
jgi:putative transcriptional regulator